MKTSEQIWEQLPKRPHFTWTFEQVDLLVTLARQGVTFKAISQEIKKKPSTVRRFVDLNRELLELERRIIHTEAVPRPKHLSFEKAWYGSVPRGHFSICKRWGSESFYRKLKAADRAGVRLETV